MPLDRAQPCSSQKNFFPAAEALSVSRPSKRQKTFPTEGEQEEDGGLPSDDSGEATEDPGRPEKTKRKKKKRQAERKGGGEEGKMDGDGEGYLEKHEEEEDDREEVEEEEEEFDLRDLYRETCRAPLGGIDGRYTLVSKFVSPEEQAKRVQVTEHQRSI